LSLQQIGAMDLLKSCTMRIHDTVDHPQLTFIQPVIVAGPFS